MSEFKKIERIEKIFLQHKRKKGRRPPQLHSCPPSLLFLVYKKEKFWFCVASSSSLFLSFSFPFQSVDRWWVRFMRCGDQVRGRMRDA